MCPLCLDRLDLGGKNINRKMLVVLKLLGKCFLEGMDMGIEPY